MCKTFVFLGLVDTIEERRIFFVIFLLYFDYAKTLFSVTLWDPWKSDRSGSRRGHGDGQLHGRLTR